LLLLVLQAGYLRAKSPARPMTNPNPSFKRDALKLVPYFRR
jgi:hypothetical protein